VRDMVSEQRSTHKRGRAGVGAGEDHFDRAKVMAAMAPGIAWVGEQCADWPVDCCSDTCQAVLDNWWNGGASKGLRGLGRKYLWSIVTGWIVLSWEQEDACHHVWLLEKRTGTIVDPTAGQFLDGPAVQIFAAESEQAKRYLTTQQYRVWRKTGSVPR